MTYNLLLIRMTPWHLGLLLLVLLLLVQYTPVPLWLDAGITDIACTLSGQAAAVPDPVEAGSESGLYTDLSPSSPVHPPPPWLEPLACGIILVLLSILLSRSTPGLALLACVVTITLVITAYLGLLILFHIRLPLANALLLALFACPLAAGLRLAESTRFLNHQLDKLARAPGVSMPSPARRHPRQLLEQLQALVPLSGWLLTDDSEVVTAHGLSQDDIQSLLLPPNQWVDLDNRSFIRIHRGQKTYILGLQLPDDLSREAIRHYLHRLDLDGQESAPRSDSHRDTTSAKIERLRSAIERMEQMHEFLRLSTERMPDGIIVTDELGVIRCANGHIEEWFQEPMPSLIGLPLARLLQGHDPRETPPWRETVSDTLILRQSQTVDLNVRGKNFLIRFAPFELPGTDQHGVIANISDITELREQQRQHREAIDFISHDVRSPLVSQMALIEHMKRNPDQVHPGQLEQLARLAHRSYHLAEEFVQLARAEQLTETRFYDCELLAIAENARDSVSEQALEKNIRLTLSGTEDLWLRGNAELLERAVINLLTNAVQYSPEGTTVSMQVYRAGHLACLSVTDEGPGIAPEELPHLFDRYQRQRRSELSGSRGAGLGLSFVKTVTEKHRGEISVVSVPEEGSSFTMKIPVADPLA